MDNIEKNIVRSFNKAKADIRELESRIRELTSSQREMQGILDTLKEHEMKLYLRLKNAPTKKQKTKVIMAKPKAKHTAYVAPKGGSRFHIKNCPFAQNIKPKNKVIFKSKTKALNQGFKPCDCVK